MHLNEFIDLGKFYEAVDFGRSFCFSWKVSCPIVEHLLGLIPVDVIPLDFILEVISFISYSIRYYSNLPIRS